MGLVLFALACKKDASIVNPSNHACEGSIDRNTTSFSWPVYSGLGKCAVSPQYLYQDSFVLEEFCGNPSNPYQIAFIRSDVFNYRSGGIEVCTYNFCTHVTAVVAKQALSGISWSKKDWLAFGAADHNIYTIKVSGDSLRRLTTNGVYNSAPSWNPSGTLLAYKDAAQKSIVVLTSSGSQIFKTTIEEGPISWIDDSNLLLSSNSTFIFGSYLKFQALHIPDSTFRTMDSTMVTGATIRYDQNTKSIIYLAYSSLPLGTATIISYNCISRVHRKLFDVASSFGVADVFAAGNNYYTHIRYADSVTQHPCDLKLWSRIMVCNQNLQNQRVLELPN
jgi:hypothetical protein